MTFVKYLAIAAFGTLAAISTSATSAGLDDVFKQADQKTSEVEAQIRLKKETEQNEYEQSKKAEGIGAQPYSQKEIGILLSFLMLGQPKNFLYKMDLIEQVSATENYPRIGGESWFNKNEAALDLVKKRIGENSFDIGRARAFGIQYFGGKQDCRGDYNPFFASSIGSETLAHTLNYINYSAKNNTEGMNNSALHIKRLLSTRSPNCSREISSTLNGNLKSFIDMLIKSKDTLISQRNSIFTEAQAIASEQDKIEKANVAKLEEDRKKRSAESDAAYEKSKKAQEELDRPYKECVASNKYKAYKASERVAHANDGLANIKNIMDRERKAASVSGYEDKDLMYRSGKMLIYWQDTSNNAYKEYKSFGGTASSAADIKTPQPNPCKKL